MAEMVSNVVRERQAPVKIIQVNGNPMKNVVGIPIMQSSGPFELRDAKAGPSA